MVEIRFLNVSMENNLPTFVRLNAETRLDAIERFAALHGLTIDEVGEETVWFTRQGHRVLFSVSGFDPLLALLLQLPCRLVV